MGIKTEYLKRLADLSGVHLEIRSNFLCYWVDVQSLTHSMKFTGFVHNFQSEAVPDILNFIKSSQNKAIDIFYLIEMKNDYKKFKKGLQYIINCQNKAYCYQDDKYFDLPDESIKVISTIVLKSKI